MKKRILILLTVFLVIFAGCNETKTQEPKKTGWETDKVKGEVKEFAISEYMIRKRGKKELRYKRIHRYDKNGYLTLDELYDSEGAVTRRVEFVNDEYGNVLSYVEIGKGNALQTRELFKYNSDGKEISGVKYAPSGSVECEYKYDYDGKGNLISFKRMVAGLKESEQKIYYDSANNRVKEEFFKFDALEGKNEYEYDANGSNTVHRVFAEDGLRTTYKTTYDDAGRIVKQVSLTSDGKMDWMKEYVYDENGNNTRFRYYNAEGIVVNETEKKFDENGNLLSSIAHSPDPYLDGREDRYEYDENGNKISQLSLRDGKVGWKFVFEYDEAGNVVKETQYRDNGDVHRISEKTYIYY